MDDKDALQLIENGKWTDTRLLDMFYNFGEGILKLQNINVTSKDGSYVNHVLCVVVFGVKVMVGVRCNNNMKKFKEMMMSEPSWPVCDEDEQLIAAMLLLSDKTLRNTNLLEIFDNGLLEAPFNNSNC